MLFEVFYGIGKSRVLSFKCRTQFFENLGRVGNNFRNLQIDLGKYEVRAKRDA